MTAPAMHQLAPGTVTTVSVTQEHISRGRKCASGECPIALAIIALGIVPEGHVVEVYNDSARIWEGSTVKLRAALPRIARSFVHTFDLCGPGAVLPFTFELTWRAA